MLNEESRILWDKKLREAGLDQQDTKMYLDAITNIVGMTRGGTPSQVETTVTNRGNRGSRTVTRYK